MNLLPRTLQASIKSAGSCSSGAGLPGPCAAVLLWFAAGAILLSAAFDIAFGNVTLRDRAQTFGIATGLTRLRFEMIGYGRTELGCRSGPLAALILDLLFTDGLERTGFVAGVSANLGQQPVAVVCDDREVVAHARHHHERESLVRQVARG